MKRTTKRRTTKRMAKESKSKMPNAKQVLAWIGAALMLCAVLIDAIAVAVFIGGCGLLALAFIGKKAEEKLQGVWKKW